MKVTRQNIKHVSGLISIKPMGIHTLTFIVVSVTAMMLPSFALAERFDPPSLTLPLQNFDSRLTGSQINVDFIFAHVLNNGRKTVREVGEITKQFEMLNNTSVFTNFTSNNAISTDGAAAGSVIIPPGTEADTIIVLNQNEGDSIAIQR